MGDEPRDGYEDELDSDAEPGVVDWLFAALRVDVLIAVGLLGIVVWMVSDILGAWIEYDFPGGTAGAPPDWHRWVLLGQSVGYALWLGPLALLAFMWLREPLPRSFDPTP